MIVLIIIAAVLCTYVLGAKAAVLLKSKSNYKYNKLLEENNNGVSSKNIVYAQEEKELTGHNAGNYHFGYTTFENVGCEVVAAYNVRNAMGNPEKLSDITRKFERWNIIYSVGFGKLGANPKRIGKYFDKEKIEYHSFKDYEAFIGVLNRTRDCHIIVSSWNNKNIFSGLHTIYIKKTGRIFDAYNYSSGDRENPSERNNINDFFDKENFIVGYILW